MSRRSRKGSKKTASRHSAKYKETPGGKRSPEATISDRDFRIISLAILLLVAWIAYSNALHNSLAFDDVTFSPSNRSWELSWEKVGLYFTSDVWATAGKESGLYRPLFLLSVAAEISLFSWEIVEEFFRLIWDMLEPFDFLFFAAAIYTAWSLTKGLGVKAPDTGVPPELLK